MLDETTISTLLMAGGLVAATLSILVLTALVLSVAQRRCWVCDRWAAFEREAYDLLRPDRRRAGPVPFRRRVV